ncbi:g7406 [Coccomyxa viridis]|uniref:G7406 protein n=1 Tax=Coccomyxa viridis TaxID=1274662 RepID=A0ABP1G4C6_9CHLO
MGEACLQPKAIDGTRGRKPRSFCGLWKSISARLFQTSSEDSLTFLDQRLERMETKVKAMTAELKELNKPASESSHAADPADDDLVRW